MHVCLYWRHLCVVTRCGQAGLLGLEACSLQLVLQLGDAVRLVCLGVRVMLLELGEVRLCLAAVRRYHRHALLHQVDLGHVLPSDSNGRNTRREYGLLQCVCLQSDT